MTLKQQEASKRNWAKAQMLSALCCLRRKRKWRHPGTATSLVYISNELEAVIAKEWPEYWIQLQARSTWNVDKTLSRKYCYAVLKNSGLTWRPKSLIELRQAASYLMLHKFEETIKCKD